VREAAGEVDVVQLAADPRCGKQRQQESPVLGLELDLLLQLTGSSDLRVLTRRVTDPRRELDKQCATGVSVLPDAANPPLLVDGQYDDSARVLDHQPTERLIGTARALDGVLAERQHPVVAVDIARSENRPGERLVRELPHLQDLGVDELVVVLGPATP
jgi:hypothetical protein